MINVCIPAVYGIIIRIPPHPLLAKPAIEK
jgi:hypothetical protein